MIRPRVNLSAVENLNDVITVLNEILRYVQTSIQQQESQDNSIGSLLGGTVIDHGTLSGLNDDDHSHYLLADGTRKATTLDVGSGLDIKGDTDELQLLINANAAQTADLVNIKNSAGTTKFEIDSTGVVTIAELAIPQINSFNNAVHDHSSTTEGGVIDHDHIINIGSNTHFDIDSHINDTTIHYIKGSINIDDLADVSVSVPSAGNILTYNGANWANVAPTPDSDEKLKVDASASADYLGNSSSSGLLRTSSPLTYTDGGDFVTISVQDATTSVKGAASFSSDDFSVTAGAVSLLDVRNSSQTFQCFINELGTVTASNAKRGSNVVISRSGFPITILRDCTLGKLAIINTAATDPGDWTLRLRIGSSGSDTATFTFGLGNSWINWAATNGDWTTGSGSSLSAGDDITLVIDGPSVGGIIGSIAMEFIYD